jgi:hypothetical protein
VGFAFWRVSVAAGRERFAVCAGRKRGWISILELQPDQFLYLLPEGLIVQRKADFYPPVDIPVHPIRGAQENVFLSLVVKDVYPAMLQVPVDNPFDGDVSMILNET